MKLPTLTKYLVAALLAATTVAASAAVTVKNVVATPRWPWNGMVDIDYLVESDDPNADVYVYPQGFDGDRNLTVIMKALSGDGAGNTAVKPGQHRITWDARADDAKLNSSKFTVSMQVFSGAQFYLVVDLSAGPDATSYPVRYTSAPPEVSEDTCRTTEMWFRLILPGTFKMGSPSSELGRDAATETLHEVTLTKPFYIGVFEVTQQQWKLVMGTDPSEQKGPARPVTNISYNMIRGSVNGSQWPSNNQVDTTSFMGKLRAKCLMTLDLPTEAQWEYACRAGTSTALNSGKDLTNTTTCPNVAEVGRYYGNRSDGKGGYGDHTKVGQYLPNAWGVYDMHGNVWEWCLDWHVANLGTAVVTDPEGPASGSIRACRGGGFDDYSYSATYVRAAKHTASIPSYGYTAPSAEWRSIGFRAAILPVP